MNPGEETFEAQSNFSSQNSLAEEDSLYSGGASHSLVTGGKGLMQVKVISRAREG